jgi:hypothetical protein
MSSASPACTFGVASCSGNSRDSTERYSSKQSRAAGIKRASSRHQEWTLSCDQVDKEYACSLNGLDTQECSNSTLHAGGMSCITHHEEENILGRRKSRDRRLAKQAWRVSWSSLVLLSILLALLMPTITLASQGDRSPEYAKCVDSCKLDSCFVGPEWDDGTAHATRLPLMLRLTGWTCVDDCKYHCTHRLTNEAYDRVIKIRQDSVHLVEAEASRAQWSTSEQRRKIEELVTLRLSVLRPVQKQMVQFHGKWVFIRFLGAQEPLSVLFSLANFQVHFRALSTLRKQVPDIYPLKLIYIMHAFLSCSAWFWSAVFHTRDRNWTEKLDYFAAGSVILGGWFIAVCRLLRLGPDTRAFNVLLKGCGIAFALHVLYLCIGRFDYSYNMKVNIFFGLFQSALWLIYSIRPLLFSQLSVKLDRFNSSRLRNIPSSPTLHGSAFHSNNGSPPAPVSAPLSPPPSSNRKSKRQLQKIILFLILASCLEVFDFPPIGRALDAHALWHAATVPLAALWYQWLVEDARECTLTGYWIGEGIRLERSETVEKIGKVASTLVGNQVVQAYEKTIERSIAAKKWVETVAGKSSNAIKDATGSSSGIEFKTLTNKLHEVATEAFGNSALEQSPSTTRNRTQSISNSKGLNDHSP